MKKTKKEKEEKLYPITYGGITYKNENEVDEIFAQFYHSRYSLNSEMGVYIGDDIWVYPNGDMDEY
jgi:hypothetical protein